MALLFIPIVFQELEFLKHNGYKNMEHNKRSPGVMERASIAYPILKVDWVYIHRISRACYG